MPNAPGSGIQPSILAFCLNHLLLKCLWVPWAAGRLLAAFQSLTETYLDGVDWEPGQDIDRRAARLLPGLFLARIDGKSPVEDLTEERAKHTAGRIARSLLAGAPAAGRPRRPVGA